jgi:hypothetical protein
MEQNFQSVKVRRMIERGDAPDPPVDWLQHQTMLSNRFAYNHCSP